MFCVGKNAQDPALNGSGSIENNLVFLKDDLIKRGKSAVKVIYKHP